MTPEPPAQPGVFFSAEEQLFPILPQLPKTFTQVAYPAPDTLGAAQAAPV